MRTHSPYFPDLIQRRIEVLIFVTTIIAIPADSRATIIEYHKKSVRICKKKRKKAFEITSKTPSAKEMHIYPCFDRHRNNRQCTLPLGELCRGPFVGSWNVRTGMKIERDV